MAKIVICARTIAVENMIRAAIPEGKHWIVASRDPSAKMQIMEMDGGPDAIILSDVVHDPEGWKNALQNFDPHEVRVTILVRAGLDESTEPYETDQPIFASVHGRTEDGEPNSLKSKIAELIKGK